MVLSTLRVDTLDFKTRLKSSDLPFTDVYLKLKASFICSMCNDCQTFGQFHRSSFRWGMYVLLLLFFYFFIDAQ